jgi:DNA-binding NarL/FixJ family response regulator
MRMHRRRILLVEPCNDDSQWLLESLTTRFKYFHVTRVHTAAEAHQELINQGYDVIVTDLFGDNERPFGVVHDLVEITPTTPIVVLAATEKLSEHMLDVTAAGIKHILYKEDVRKDISKLVAAVVEIVHELGRRDTMRDAVSERMHAVSRKVNDVDGRMRAMERTLEGIVQSINAMVQVIEKRGGLEDRVKELENTKTNAIKFGVWAAGALGALASAVIAGVVAYLKR